jgi:hypothetical protein
VSSHEGRPSPRVSVQRQWWIREPNAIEPAVEQVASAHAMIAAYDRGAVVLRGGSDATSATGPFASDRALPKRGRLERSGTQHGFTLVRLRLEDALESAVMDSGLRRRYAAVLDSIVRDLATALAAMTEVHDAGPHPALGDG